MSERHEPPSDLAARIERAAAPELDQLATRARRRTVLALGAALAVPALFLAALLTLPAEIVSPQRPGADWFAQRVGPDGRFEPESWNGPRAAEAGMQGLGLLAFARLPEADADVVERAGDWLLARQRPDGALADVTQDHAVATLALLEAWQRTQTPEFREGAESALTCLVERVAETPRVGEADAAWSLQTLLAARDAGLCTERRAAFDRARNRLQSQLGGPMPRAALAEATLSPVAAPRRAGLGELYVATVAKLSADVAATR